MMCADFLEIEEQLKIFEEEQIEYLHIDVMDGHFVPNLTLGTDYAKKLKANSRIPLDYHFMVQNPENFLEWFPVSEGDLVSIHYESTPHVQRVLSRIRQKGAKAMIALNPATPIYVLEDILPDIDGVLIMSVNPGFAGQAMIPQVLQKIRRTREWLEHNDRPEVEIEVDGNVSFENAAKMSAAGATIFVAGTSSVFGPSVREGIVKLRSVL